MSTLSTNSRLANIEKKVCKLCFVDRNLPEPSTHILDLFKANTAARTDFSNEWIIDVFPNMSPILCYVMLMSLRHATAVQHCDHSKLSVATICMYHMAIVYGYFLLNDLYVRPTPSAYSRSWSQISWKNDFANFLLTLPVPEFLTTVLSQFHSTETDRSKNVFFVPSAAGYDHNQFFGRVFPLNLFAAIHDCTATLPGNSTRFQILNDLFSRVLYSIQDPNSILQDFECLIPDLLGITISQTNNRTANHMNSKLYQVFSSVFNPVLFRNFQRRSSLAVLSFKSPVYSTNQINAYDLMFSATSANLRELKVVLQAISTILVDAVPCKFSLSDFISQGATHDILKHGYSTFALPTWSASTNAKKSELFSEITVLALVSDEERAQDFCFLQRPAAEIPHPYEIIDITPANPALKRRFPFCLRLDAPATGGFPQVTNEDLVKFCDYIHTAPSVLVLDTDGKDVTSAHLALLAGKIIESFELDGSTVEMPNALKSLGMQNCMFADSAIPYRYVRPGSFYRPREKESVLPPLNRAVPNPKPRLPAASLVYDRTMVMLPQFNTKIHEKYTDYTDYNTLPGMTRRSPVNVARYAQSFIGFRTVDHSGNSDNLDAIPAMPEAQLLIWSPYTYTPYEGDDFPDPNPADSRHYYLTNLRTFFGTDYNLVQCKHPYEALPVGTGIR